MFKFYSRYRISPALCAAGCLINLLIDCMPQPGYRNTRYRERPGGINTQIETGLASYMGENLHGRTTASGEIFNMWALTAAHRTLPFGTIVRVKNLENNKTVDVRINDRGPFKRGRIIDLSYAAAGRLDFINNGLTKVEIRIVQSIR